MTTTLVVGDGTSIAMEYAAWLLRQDGHYTPIDAAAAGTHLVGAILGSRSPVLLHGIESWVEKVVPHDELHAGEGYAEVSTDLYDQVDEVVVARRHVPMDVVTVTQTTEWGWPTSQAYRNHLSYVNGRLSASSDRVHLLVAGRILDLSTAPIVPRFDEPLLPSAYEAPRMAVGRPDSRLNGRVPRR